MTFQAPPDRNDLFTVLLSDGDDARFLENLGHIVGYANASIQCGLWDGRAEAILIFKL
jgi:hypothetical protein